MPDARQAVDTGDATPYRWHMCRNITTLRGLEPSATPDEIEAAARQYVRKVSGFRTPASHNAQVFQDAVDAITAATEQLLDGLVVKGSPAA